jgi:hypothetical protein
MSCCGSRRPSLSAGLSTSRASALAGAGPGRAAAPVLEAVPAPLARARDRSLTFEYTGAGAFELHATGSGRSYRFAGPGDHVTIDPADWAQMFRTPWLRHIA